MDELVTLRIACLVLFLAGAVSSAILERLPIDAEFPIDDLKELVHTKLVVRGNTEAQCNSYTTLGPGDSANFKTPNYPGNYGNLGFCKWIFAGSTNDAKITISCDEFAMYESSWSSSCIMNDNLSLWLGLLNKKWYCGSKGPENIISDGNWVVAKFHSGLFYNAKGFSCTAKVSGGTTPATTPGPTVTAPIVTTTP